MIEPASLSSAKTAPQRLSSTLAVRYRLSTFRRLCKRIGAYPANVLSPSLPTDSLRFRLLSVPPLARQILQPVEPAGDHDDLAVVAHAARNGAGHHVVAEHHPSAADANIGGDDSRPLLAVRRNQLEEQIGSRGRGT